MATQKTLSKGSPAPGPVPTGHIRLYSMRFCPFAHRTRLVLHAKGIKHETINVSLKDKPDWFVERNPYGSVPVLETESGQVIYESPITCDFLDEVYGGTKLLPADPFAKAQQKMMLEHWSKIVTNLYKIPMAVKKGEDVTAVKDQVKSQLGKLNEDLVKNKNKFFAGDSISMIDYMMWPWFERLALFDLQGCLDHTPELKKWTELMSEDSAVRATMHNMDNHKAFFKSYLEGNPDYDLGL